MIKNLLKIFSVAVLSLSMMSCTPEATGDSAVGFASSSLEVNAARYLKIPIYVTGKTTVYPIELTVDVQQGSMGIINTDYLVTSTKLKIQEGMDSVNLEIYIPDMTVALDFTLTITKASNAQSISTPTTAVTVMPAKNDISSMYGEYTLTANSGAGYGSGSVTASASITNPDLGLQLMNFVPAVQNVAVNAVVSMNDNEEFSGIAVLVGGTDPWVDTQLTTTDGQVLEGLYLLGYANGVPSAAMSQVNGEIARDGSISFTTEGICIWAGSYDPSIGGMAYETLTNIKLVPVD